jgi:thermostable 8-oxoguanine DNA glycosylase
MQPNDDAIVIMLTDGEENSSRVYDFRQISEFMEQLTATEKWTFTLLGADIDAFEAIGSKLNMRREQVFMYKKEQTREAFDEVNVKMTNFFEKKSKGESTKDAFLFGDLF